MPHARHRLVAVLLAALVGCACQLSGGAPTVTSIATAVPFATATATDRATPEPSAPPSTPSAGATASAASTAAPPPSVGTVESFWIPDSARRRYFQARARLVRRSAHFDVWVAEAEPADEAAIGRSLDQLGNRILPTVLQQFGGGKINPERLRVAIVNVRVGGIIGYYSSVNEYPR